MAYSLAGGMALGQDWFWHDSSVHIVSFPDLCQKGERGLRTIDRFSWTLPECWQSQSDSRIGNCDVTIDLKRPKILSFYVTWVCNENAQKRIAVQQQELADNQSMTSFHRLHSGVERNPVYTCSPPPPPPPSNVWERDYCS